MFQINFNDMQTVYAVKTKQDKYLQFKSGIGSVVDDKTDASIMHDKTFARRFARTLNLMKNPPVGFEKDAWQNIKPLSSVSFEW